MNKDLIKAVDEFTINYRNLIIEEIILEIQLMFGIAASETYVNFINNHFQLNTLQGEIQ
jgi:hypothetical protein